MLLTLLFSAVVLGAVAFHLWAAVRSLRAYRLVLQTKLEEQRGENRQRQLITLSYGPFRVHCLRALGKICAFTVVVVAVLNPQTGREITPAQAVEGLAFIATFVVLDFADLYGWLDIKKMDKLLAEEYHEEAQAL